MLRSSRIRPRLIVAAAVAAASLYLVAATWADNIEFRTVMGNSKQIHWSDENATTPWARFVDHTGTNWPVLASVNEWDFAGRINAIYDSGSCGGSHCAGVNSFDFGSNCGTDSGRAILAYYASGHLAGGGTRVELNQRCADNVGQQYTNADRRVIICEETGHILGIEHDIPAGIANTCMAATTANFDQAVNTPRPHDFVMLDDRIYDHND